MANVIMGVDPGKTTGIAILDVESDKVFSTAVMTVEALVGCILTGHPTVVVVEDYVGSGPRSAEAIRTLKLVGIVVGACEALRIPYSVRPPQVRLPHVAASRARLPRRSIHERDAFAHVLSYREQQRRHG